MSKFTKRAIAESFMKLLSDMPFDKITVKDIAADCGISRNTFYYNFKDIYELVDVILQNEISLIIKSHTKPYSDLNESFLQAADFAVKNKKAVYHLYNSVKKQQVAGYFERIIHDIMTDLVSGYAENCSISKENIDFISRFYTSALLGILEKWLDNGMKKELDDLIYKTGLLFTSNIETSIRILSDKN